jgi:hypothetical protein
MENGNPLGFYTPTQYEAPTEPIPRVTIPPTVGDPQGHASEGGGAHQSIRGAVGDYEPADRLGPEPRIHADLITPRQVPADPDVYTRRVTDRAFDPRSGDHRLRRIGAALLPERARGAVKRALAIGALAMTATALLPATSTSTEARFVPLGSSSVSTQIPKPQVGPAAQRPDFTWAQIGTYNPATTHTNGQGTFSGVAFQDLKQENIPTTKKNIYDLTGQLLRLNDISSWRKAATVHAGAWIKNVLPNSHYTPLHAVHGHGYQGRHRSSG